MMKPLLPSLAALLALVTAPAIAATSNVQLIGGWSRPAVAGANGVGYVTVVNNGSKAETIVRVETPLAEKVEMHSVSMMGGVMRMAPVPTLIVPAGGKVDFAPGGYHLMLLNLKKPLNIGDKAPVTFAFASGAHVKGVLGVGVMAPSM